MANTKENKLKKQNCEQLYVEMDKSVDELVAITGMSDKTIYRWIKQGKWDEKKNETQTIEKQIDINMRKALNHGLKSFAENPGDKDLQSLVGLLKQFKEKNKPSQAYKDNIIRFIDRTTDYFLEKDMPETADIFKSSIMELAEYLLSRA